MAVVPEIIDPEPRAKQYEMDMEADVQEPLQKQSEDEADDEVYEPTYAKKLWSNGMRRGEIERKRGMKPEEIGLRRWQQAEERRMLPLKGSTRGAEPCRRVAVQLPQLQK